MDTPLEDRTEEQKEEVKTAKRQRKNAKNEIESVESTLKLNPKKPRRKDATWFFEVGRSVEIVDWLVQHPTEREQIDWMASRVGDASAVFLTQYPGTHRRLADHFWCDILASLARALSEILGAMDEAPTRVAEVFICKVSSRTWDLFYCERNSDRGNAPTQLNRTREKYSRLSRDHREKLNDVILKKAVVGLVTAILSGVNEGAHLTLGHIVLKLRILAILFCPDPYSHRSVWDNCLVPLTREGVVIGARNYIQRFIDMFKKRWSWSV